MRKTSGIDQDVFTGAGIAATVIPGMPYPGRSRITSLPGQPVFCSSLPLGKLQPVNNRFFTIAQFIETTQVKIDIIVCAKKGRQKALFWSCPGTSSG